MPSGYQPNTADNLRVTGYVTHKLFLDSRMNARVSKGPTAQLALAAVVTTGSLNWGGRDTRTMYHAIRATVALFSLEIGAGSGFSDTPMMRVQCILHDARSKKPKHGLKFESTCYVQCMQHTIHSDAHKEDPGRQCNAISCTSRE